jgi:dTDP-4-amino-4,6-dideoxygalactose transaminase
LTPVFIDVNPQTFNIEASEVEKAISPKTKAIVPVHLYGQCVDMEPLIALGKKHNIPVIEDNAQAIGSEYFFADGSKMKTGTIGTIGTTSFFPSKNLGCYGDGGAITTNDDVLAEKMKMIANHGQSVRYYHDMIGVNSRLDTIQAAVLGVKLKYLDEYIDARRTAADYYDRAFANHPKIKTPFRSSDSKHVFHQYTLVVEEKRNELVEFLKTQNIPAMIYYPVTCHQQKAFEGKGRIVGDMKNTLWLSERVVSLPMHTELDEEQLKFITDSVLEFYRN